MDDNYLNELGKIPASRLNDIMYAVSCGVPKDEIGLKTETEKTFYESLVDQAEAHKKKYGEYPVFEMAEIEYDDPRLDIYSDSING